MMKDKVVIIDSLIMVMTHVSKEVDYERMLSHGEGEIAATRQKKDRLLDLHIAGAITIEEFKEPKAQFGLLLNRAFVAQGDSRRLPFSSSGNPGSCTSSAAEWRCGYLP